MLTKISKGACALAGALTFSATAAQADWQTVNIDDGAYLPTVTYLNQGDNIVFYNESEHTHTINGPDESWTSGPIAPGARYLHRIERDAPLTFSGEASDGEIMEGSFTYEPAPLDEGS